MPEARHGGAFAVVDGALVCLGGATVAGGLATESLRLAVA